MNKKTDDIFRQMDAFSLENIPFFFMIDFEQTKPILYQLSDLVKDNFDDIIFEFPKYKTKYNTSSNICQPYVINKQPIDFAVYQKQFNQIVFHLKRGDSFLINLTCETPIRVNTDLKTIFEHVDAKYKIYFKDQFVCFSPETFIRVKDNKISTFPMKGTIDASLDNAESVILNNPKEMAEHATIVDLLRNDLSMVAFGVHVKRYRYIEKIKTREKELLQVSSEIEGKLQDKYIGRMGMLLKQLLPAGSISGAPKDKTIKIIKATESHNREYYTGICGVFDGKNLDTCVMIRYIEQRDGQLYYKSGGGITFQSDAKEEYNEMINKIYVPQMD